MFIQIPHTVILFIELIKLYVLSNDTTSIPKESLKKAFKELIEIVKEETNSDLIYSYEAELTKFLSAYPDFFKESPTTIELTEDIEIIYDYIIKSIKPNIMDFDISRLVYNTDIYQALEIGINETAIKPYFDANKNFLSILTSIAYQEYHNEDISHSLSALENSRDYLIGFFNSIDNATLTKLNIATHLYDFKYMPEVIDNEDYPWMVILFSNSEKKWETITYSTIASYANETSEEQNDEKEALLNDFLSQEDYYDEESSISLNAIEVFLQMYLIYLNKFLKITGEFPSKETLIIKKYLLLSLPELGFSLEHLLENNNLDNLELPSIPPSIPIDYESELYCSCTSIISNIQVSDTQIAKNPDLYSTLITSALFIKCFLKLIKNNELKDDLISLLINPEFYKNPSYKLATDAIDNIIFNDNLDLVR